MRRIHTFSLAARDPETGDFGVAVASKFLAVGAVVPHARAGIGAVATQSYANPRFGPWGLELLAEGVDPGDLASIFRTTDHQMALRQFGAVNAKGNAYSFTGADCHAWASGRSGANYAAQGNLLAGPQVVEALSETFEAQNSLPFPEKLLAALLAADQAGGDKRGRQSAALLVVGAGKGYAGLNDRWIDLRVDDHQTPIAGLERLLSQHRLFFERPEETRKLTTEEVRFLQRIMREMGLYEGPLDGIFGPGVDKAFHGLIGIENLEERYLHEGELDEATLAYLKEKFQ